VGCETRTSPGFTFDNDAEFLSLDTMSSVGHAGDSRCPVQHMTRRLSSGPR
jgi:hypothetical protein